MSTGLPHPDQVRARTAGVSSRRKPATPGQIVSLVVPGLVGPAALFFGMLVHAGCTVLNVLNLPWDPGVDEAVRIAAFAIAVVSFVLVVRGFWIAPWTSGTILLVWAASAPALLIVLLLLSFGDPAPGSCPNSA